LYKVKEIYYTLQGEGFHAGRPAVFLRFAGCNLWSGREEDRAQAVCDFCDTDFRGTDGPLGGSYSKEELAALISGLWPVASMDQAFVVCTGGEPLLQLDEELIDAFQEVGFQVAVETNGTIKAPKNLDWVCVSPKAGSQLVQREGHELKLVYPQSGIQPEEVQHWTFDYFYLQPMESEQWDDNTKATIEYCKLHPKWRLSAQTHKYLGIP